MPTSRSIEGEVDHKGVPHRIGIISLSVIPDDPRVRKQGELLARAGWQVVAIGLPGHRSSLPSWRCVTIDEGQTIVPRDSTSHDDEADYRIRASALLAALREAVYPQCVSPVTAWPRVFQQAILLTIRDPTALLWTANAVAGRLSRGRVWMRAVRLLRMAGGAITSAYAERLYWDLNDKFRQLYETARDERVDLWLANDWTSLPIARKLALEQDVPFAYDTHELAVDEYAQRWTWRLVQRPVITAIEGTAMKEAAFVSCVSDGIARRLTQFYNLKKQPLVVRNMAPYEPIRIRPTGERIRVLYHGLVSPGRALEACIESVSLWRPEFTLTIRGPGTADYIAHLCCLAQQRGVADRVTFAPPVPMVDLVRTAAEHDVGLFALPSHSLQNVYVLPNKFFEYMMAGLALCVSDLPEMSRIVKGHDLGVLIEAATPQAIATVINRLDRAAIDAYKRNALAGAREFNWEIEGRRLLEACEYTVSPRRAVALQDRAAGWCR